MAIGGHNLRMKYIKKTTITRRILREFRKAGWTRDLSGKLVPPEYASKDHIRLGTVAHRASRAKRDEDLVREAGPELLKYFASGKEIDPTAFDIEIRPVEKGSLEAELFRFAALFWSIPISRGYGRRMRYLVFDRSNGKVVGLFALGDPVFNLGARDETIGWDVHARKQRLYHVLDAYALGAVPPYNRLLCGKLMAMLAVSNEVRADFNEKYRSAESILSAQHKKASLVLVTTTSALGRSSIYNRIRLPGEPECAYRRVGFTRGFGHFHITDELFEVVRSWLRQRKDPYADGNRYGHGPNWRMRVLRRAFDLLGIESVLMKHGVQREVFLAPLAKNYDLFLKGDHLAPRYYDRSAESIVEFFKERWMIPRSDRVVDWNDWTRSDGWAIISGLYANSASWRNAPPNISPNLV